MQVTCLKIYYTLLSSAKYFFRFSMKVVCIYVTHYMKHVLGYGVFTKKQIKKRRTNLELSWGINRWGDSSGTGETIWSRRERKLFVLLYAK